MVGRGRRLAAAAVVVMSGSLAGVGPAAAPATADAARSRACEHRSNEDRTAPARGRRLMVAAAHPLAAAAGCRVLAGGGMAADAAIAVQMVLAVVEPQSSGLGGGTLITYYDRRSGRVEFYDGLAAAPAAVTEGLRTPTAAEMESLGVDSFGAAATYSGRAVGVPGTVAVLDQIHQRRGHAPWSGLFDAAVDLAENGFAMPRYLHDTMSAPAGGVPRCDYPDLAARYCRDGAPIPVGETVRNTDLAAVLREVRDGGAAAFYDPAGRVAPAIVERAARGPFKLAADESGPAVIPSLMTVADLGGYRAVGREPLCRWVLDRQVCTAAPPSFGGLSVLQQLGLLERADVAAMAPDSLLRTHYSIEASRLAQFDRRQYVGDPDFDPVPVAGLLAGEYLDSRFALLSPTTAVREVAPGRPGGDEGTTSNVSIVDRAGNALSMTTTINSSFGAQIEARGIALNNVQENFTRPDSISPGQRVNGMEPGKRPRTSIAPTVVLDHAGRLDLVVGAAGGSAIPDYITQATLGVLVDGLDPQTAINQGHWSGQEIASDCGGVIGPRSELEEGTAAAGLLDRLRELRHPCARVVELRSGLTAVDVDGRGLLYGAADPRRDGAAVGY
ncbi:gamma-glutamyltransferase [Phytohabitans sp. ZYX-F-186]|uniref:Gamma-glutamyltransferase n=1 Tax=Phytohabitans maris TaxID=3071409 RepID=A0ABU0ZUV3_9ACTN|nr:gamma-glutamyltransferase [Phytohabitans sp. ZYX-F-186]MDQ7910819.1 gamma-glutamyltransferase [Phytohabitans sp. ZYX-F-186]